MRKDSRRLQQPAAQHWVGDGFPVRAMMSPGSHGQQLSPFLLLDYAGTGRVRAGGAAARRRASIPTAASRP